MDIRRALIDEHSKRQTMKIVEFIGEDAQKFKELAEIFFSGEYIPASFRVRAREILSAK